jgi:hypothetical protein
VRFRSLAALPALIVGAVLSPPVGADGTYAVVHHPIAANAAAQANFDRGLTLLYAFSRTAARAAFVRASVADPRAAMPYWGIAMSHGGNINVPPDVDGERRAVVALARAKALAANASASDRAYIAAAETRFSASLKPDFAALDRAYHVAMQAVAQEYPRDPDAGTLYAESGMNLRPWDLYAPDGTPRPGTDAICLTLENVLRYAPSHIGANHLYIHATEASRHPERGVQAAGMLASLRFEPAASHLTHMPSHTLARAGYFRESAGSNVLATADDRRYLGGTGRRDQEQGFYYVHNLTFLAYSADMDGNLKQALSLNPRLYALDFQIPPLFTLIRFAQWPAVLALPRPKPSKYEPMREAFWRFARGMAYASSGRIAAASRERANLRAVLATLHVPAAYGINNSSAALGTLAVDVLSAKIAVARGDLAGAVPMLRAASAAQDRLIYIEPPDWYFPVRESLGGTLLRLGRNREAAAVFEADLARNQRNPRSLFGLETALAALGDESGSKRIDRNFRDEWSAATVPISVAGL